MSNATPQTKVGLIIKGLIESDENLCHKNGKINYNRAAEKIGINHPKQLVHQDPFKMYKILCEKTQTRIDPCVLDVFMSAVDFMEGKEPRPWWKYTRQRKSLFK